jgi:MGT family glycosyltransferase
MPPLVPTPNPSNFADIDDWVRRTIFKPALAYATDIQNEIARSPTDAVLSIDVIFGAMLGAEAAGVPVAMRRPLPGVPPISSGLVQPRTPEERAEVLAANEGMVELLNRFLPDLNEACAELGISGMADGLEIFDRPQRFLLAISKAFDFQADSVPDNFRYVGPLLDQPSWSKPWQAPWPAQREKPCVLVACSTGAQGQRDLVQRIINALGSVKVEAVATAGPNLDIADLQAAPNVRLLHSAPHNAVMKEVSLVITQGGHGTVNRSLIHGVPMLVLPLARDQHANAARVDARGAGLRLDANASEEEIAAAVKRLTEEAHFAAAAQRLGDAIRADIEASSVVSELEAMAAELRASLVAEKERALSS